MCGQMQKRSEELTLEDGAPISVKWQYTMKLEVDQSNSHIAAVGTRRLIGKYSGDEPIRGSARSVCELRIHDLSRFGLFGNSQELLVLEVYTAVLSHNQARSFGAEGQIVKLHGPGLAVVYAIYKG